MHQIVKIITYFICFTVSFYCLSGVDFSKILLMNKSRVVKAQLLLVLLSLALGYLSGQFLIAIQGG
ncbi:MAG: DUF1146 family protein [Erysipelotrichaceae bacterium]